MFYLVHIYYIGNIILGTIIFIADKIKTLLKTNDKDEKIWQSVKI